MVIRDKQTGQCFHPMPRHYSARTCRREAKGGYEVSVWLPLEARLGIPRSIIDNPVASTWQIPMNYETCEYNGISDQLRHDVLFYHSIPVFPGFPGRRDRILSLEIMSRD